MVLMAATGCGDDATDGVNPAPAGSPWSTLAKWGLFEDPRLQVPAAGVYPYEVISPLFSDYTEKHRFFWVPEGETIGYSDDGVWDFPVGAILIKTFAYRQTNTSGHDIADERLMETRLLVREPDGWEPHTYVWNAAQTAAELKIAGVFVEASFVDADGETHDTRYVVPTKNQCFECHGTGDKTGALGLKSAQLDRDAHPRWGVSGPNTNQLAQYQAAGLLDRAPATSRQRFSAPEDTSASLSHRARSYLDANCAHCHSPAGDTASKGLYLDFQSTDPTQPVTNWGVCKLPTSAGGSTCGHTYDVVPGSAETSVMICRMTSTEGKDQMPPVGRSIAHDEGLALISEWIDAMEPTGCGPNP